MLENYWQFIYIVLLCISKFSHLKFLEVLLPAWFPYGSLAGSNNFRTIAVICECIKAHAQLLLSDLLYGGVPRGTGNFAPIQATPLGRWKKWNRGADMAQKCCILSPVAVCENYGSYTGMHQARRECRVPLWQPIQIAPLKIGWSRDLAALPG